MSVSTSSLIVILPSSCGTPDIVTDVTLSLKLIKKKRLNESQFSRYHIILNKCSCYIRGWWGGAMVLGKLPVQRRPTIGLQ